MAITTPIKIRGKTLHVSWQPTDSKSDLARFLLDEGYTVNEISKAVPMAYSQVHQIDKKRVVVGAHGPAPKAENDRWVKASREVRGTVETKAARAFAGVGGGWGDLPPKGRPKTKPTKLKTSPKVGKLRTPGLPGDIDVGPCANCGHDLAVTRGGSTGYLIKHINITAEEHLAVTQFCNATPQVLLS